MGRNLYQRIGLHLRVYRRLTHMTQEELAEKAEISVHHLGFLERGQAKPSLDTLERLAEALGVRTEELFQLPKSTRQDPDALVRQITDQLKRCSPEGLRFLHPLIAQFVELLPPAKRK